MHQQGCSHTDVSSFLSLSHLASHRDVISSLLISSQAVACPSSRAATPFEVCKPLLLLGEANRPNKSIPRLTGSDQPSPLVHPPLSHSHPTMSLPPSLSSLHATPSGASRTSSFGESTSPTSPACPVPSGGTLCQVPPRLMEATAGRGSTAQGLAWHHTHAYLPLHFHLLGVCGYTPPNSPLGNVRHKSIPHPISQASGLFILLIHGHQAFAFLLGGPQ